MTGFCIPVAQSKNKHAIKLIEISEINAAVGACPRFRGSTEKAATVITWGEALAVFLNHGEIIK